VRPWKGVVVRGVSHPGVMDGLDPRRSIGRARTIVEGHQSEWLDGEGSHNKRDKPRETEDEREIESKCEGVRGNAMERERS